MLNTQGLPYSINGVGDLLALFRCISCKYKFSTDVTKPQQMGAGGCCAARRRACVRVRVRAAQAAIELKCPWPAGVRRLWRAAVPPASAA